MVIIKAQKRRRIVTNLFMVAIDKANDDQANETRNCFSRYELKLSVPPLRHQNEVSVTRHSPNECIPHVVKQQHNKYRYSRSKVLHTVVSDTNTSLPAVSTFTGVCYVNILQYMYILLALSKN